MIIMATCHTSNYAELSAATWDNNKLKYAERHGYAPGLKTRVPRLLPKASPIL